VELFHFTPFGKKRLQTAPEAAREALPNGALEKTPFVPIYVLTYGSGFFLQIFLLFLEFLSLVVIAL
jgi:hypothetical protein